MRFLLAPLLVSCVGGPAEKSEVSDTSVTDTSVSDTSSPTGTNPPDDTSGTRSTANTGSTAETGATGGPCTGVGNAVAWDSLGSGVLSNQSTMVMNEVNLGLFSDATSFDAWVAGRSSYYGTTSPNNYQGTFDTSSVDWSQHDVLVALVFASQTEHAVEIVDVRAVGAGPELCVETRFDVPYGGNDIVTLPWSLATVPKGHTVGEHHTTVVYAPGY